MLSTELLKPLVLVTPGRYQNGNSQSLEHIYIK